MAGCDWEQEASQTLRVGPGQAAGTMAELAWPACSKTMGGRSPENRQRSPQQGRSLNLTQARGCLGT